MFFKYICLMTRWCVRTDWSLLCWLFSLFFPEWGFSLFNLFVFFYCFLFLLIVDYIQESIGVPALFIIGFSVYLFAEKKTIIDFNWYVFFISKQTDRSCALSLLVVICFLLWHHTSSHDARMSPGFSLENIHVTLYTVCFVVKGSKS